ncbi:MAG TPA: carboxypeptidase-like regulatory domain-containing protein [Gemmatimonadaceae bacterium]|nr:carboxypeptidase-like regulatory domain-containing protein [Gemmatimonadaceae bacterium]
MALRAGAVGMAGWLPSLALVAAACGAPAPGAADSAAGAHDGRRNLAMRARQPLGGIAAAMEPTGDYHVVDVANPGAIAGRIRLANHPPRRDVTLTGDDVSACGRVLRDGSVQGYGNDLEGVLVWVSGVDSGQALPRLRRAALQIHRCVFVPRVLAVAQGTTINLQSRDDAVHRTRFYSESTDSLLSRMLTVDRWAVVPSAAIAADPGFVHVSLSQQPFARGYVAVFQHPYFDVTDRYGRYRIAGLPAGTYHLRVWHERGGVPLDRVVKVSAGLQATFDTTLVLH